MLEIKIKSSRNLEYINYNVQNAIQKLKKFKNMCEEHCWTKTGLYIFESLF